MQSAVLTVLLETSANCSILPTADKPLKIVPGGSVGTGVGGAVGVRLGTDVGLMLGLPVGMRLGDWVCNG